MRLRLSACVLLLLALPAAAAPPLRIAAAANLKPALDALVVAFVQEEPGASIDAIYGSSGKLHAQIRNGAPFDLFFSADRDYPQSLADSGHSHGPPRTYARGRIVLWSRTREAEALRLELLEAPAVTRIAIANPRLAPYGRAAEQALRRSGLWERIAHKLVYGENIAQTAQFAASGNTEVGIIALSLALNPALARSGRHIEIPEDLHDPIEQDFIITRRGAAHPLASRFAAFVMADAGRAILQRHGFSAPLGAKAAGTD
ncbi:MAG TPA: molybdate ABC transporter substrate-binding protein [Arenimonas sp.]|nr:molybdate ABC transporter substrate-binding protein [Arenimonas sp.]